MNNSFAQLTICAALLFGAIYMGCSNNSGGVDLFQAVRDEDTAGIETFAKSGGDLNCRNWSGVTALFEALHEKKRESFRKLLELGADPNLILRGGRVVTTVAAARKDSYWLKTTLEHGGDPNVLNIGATAIRQATPLEFASGMGTFENMKMLIDRGADISAVTEAGDPILIEAFFHGQYQAVLYMLERGANYNVKYRSGETFIEIIRRMPPDMFRHEEVQQHVQAIRDWLKGKGVEIDAELSKKSSDFKQCSGSRTPAPTGVHNDVSRFV